MFLVSLRYGLVVRIAGSHPAGPGSIPGNGILFRKIFLPPQTSRSKSKSNWFKN
jgi:hypothetical protein